MCSLNVAFIALISALIALPAAALPEDKGQPIHIKADKAMRDEKRGITVYSGNVSMDQGTLHIEAEKITIYRITEEADKIVARGKPARLSQQPAPDKAAVHAEAGIIEYYKSEDRVRLSENASLKQEGSTVTGATIDYFIADQLVKANSNREAQDSRVEVIIPASSLQADP